MKIKVFREKERSLGHGTFENWVNKFLERKGNKIESINTFQEEEDCITTVITYTPIEECDNKSNKTPFIPPLPPPIPTSPIRVVITLRN